MKKDRRTLITWSMIVIIIIAVISAFVLARGKKVSAKETLNKYFEAINNKDYETMYEMISKESKDIISKEDFIERNKKIYSSIDLENIKITVNSEEKENRIEKINYNVEMVMASGKINFENNTELQKEDKNGFYIKWNSNMIYPNLNDTDKMKFNRISATRGEIQDRNGIVLAGEGQISSVGIVKGKLGDEKKENISKIANLLNISIDEIEKKLSASWVTDEVFVPIKKVAKENSELKNKLLQIAGIKITTEKARVYPFGEATSLLTGYIGEITAEELQKNFAKGYNQNSLIGKTGIERSFEETLKGTDGMEISIQDKDGKKKETILKMEAINGRNVKLTVDSKIQTLLYNELKNDTGFFVTMNPYTGEVLALVSTPTYNSNDFILGVSTEQWNNLSKDEKLPMIARYTKNYCPGSTFKPITGAIGLSINSLSENDIFNYSGLSWKKDSSWGNYEITTLTSYSGAKNLKNALMHSDNIYFAQAALKIGKENFINGLNKLKFGESIDFELNLSKSQYANNGKLEKETLLADTGYGQGEILVNPIHMASVYSAFLNEGNMVKPYLEYKEEKGIEYLVENAITKEAAEIIKEDLLQVVESPEGTAHDMQLQSVKIAGKTGTAELKTAKGENGETLGWFDCFTVDESKENAMLIVSMVENAKENGGSHYLIKKIRTIWGQ